MEFWLDTTDPTTILEAKALGLLHGVTTNPSLLAKAVETERSLVQLLQLQEGPIMVQVTSATASEMLQEAYHLVEISDRIVVKVPVTKEGLKTIYQLSQKGIPTLGTAVFTATQALLAAHVGAQYIAPYLSHMSKAAIDPFLEMEQMLQIYGKQKLPTKILAASLSSPEDIVRCAQMGVPALTLKKELFFQLVSDHSATLGHIARFDQEWRRVFGSENASTLFSSNAVSGTVSGS